MERPKCMHCGKEGEPRSGRIIHPRRPDLHRNQFFACPTCPDVYVGCHSNGRPLGRVMVNKPTRTARIKAHEEFDRLWHFGIYASRRDAYTALAGFLGVSLELAHIGELNEDQALSVAAWAKRRLLADRKKKG